MAVEGVREVVLHIREQTSYRLAAVAVEVVGCGLFRGWGGAGFWMDRAPHGSPDGLFTDATGVAEEGRELSRNRRLAAL
jgi:hypothetical protein